MKLNWLQRRHLEKLINDRPSRALFSQQPRGKETYVMRQMQKPKEEESSHM